MLLPFTKAHEKWIQKSKSHLAPSLTVTRISCAQHFSSSLLFLLLLLLLLFLCVIFFLLLFDLLHASLGSFFTFLLPLTAQVSCEFESFFLLLSLFLLSLSLSLSPFISRLFSLSFFHSLFFLALLFPFSFSCPFVHSWQIISPSLGWSLSDHLWQDKWQ